MKSSSSFMNYSTFFSFKVSECPREEEGEKNERKYTLMTNGGQDKGMRGVQCQMTAFKP